MVLFECLRIEKEKEKKESNQSPWAGSSLGPSLSPSLLFPLLPAWAKPELHPLSLSFSRVGRAPAHLSPSARARSPSPALPRLPLTVGPHASALLPPLLFLPRRNGPPSEISGDPPCSGPARQCGSATVQRAAPPNPNPSSCVARGSPAPPVPFSSAAPSPLRHRGHAVPPHHSQRELAHRHRLVTPELLSPSSVTSGRSSVRIAPELHRG
jgi:hypothetical protein